MVKDTPLTCAYLDNILVSSRSEAEYLKTLQTMLERLESNGLKLKKSKYWLDLNIVITDAPRPVQLSGSPREYHCRLQLPTSTEPVYDNHVAWDPLTAQGLQYVHPHILRLDSSTPEGVYSPVCRFTYDPFVLNNTVEFLVLASPAGLMLTMHPSSSVIIIDDIDILFVRLTWYGERQPSEQALLDAEPRYCQGWIDRREDDPAAHPLSFVNYLPAIELHTGLLQLNCSCSVGDTCFKSFIAYLVRLMDMELFCIPRLTVNLEQGQQEHLLCEHRYTVEDKRIQSRLSSTTVRRKAACTEQTGHLDVRDGKLRIQLPFPPLGSYEVDCASNQSLIPVHIYSEYGFGLLQEVE
ncbi:unnamed protein product [Dicrocoelium dendriticum]|nr:unnamed protein product [Dicrocoelium dendriticum]